MSKAERELQRKVKKELNRIRREFDRTVHANLTEYLDTPDKDTGITMRDNVIAAMHRGYTVQVGLVLEEPDKETEVEAQAKASGIKIVKA